MKRNKITESLKHSIVSETANKILSELDWSTVNSYASKKQDRDRAANNQAYGVNNFHDMQNVDDEDYWNRDGDIDIEYNKNKNEAQKRFIEKYFPSLEPSDDNLRVILDAFEHLDTLYEDILHYSPLDEDNMNTWRTLLNAYFDFRKHKEQGGYTDEWGR